MTETDLKIFDFLLKCVVWVVSFVILVYVIKPLLNPLIPNEIVYAIFGSISMWLSCGSKLT